jgi:hypothetical protein
MVKDANCLIERLTNSPKHHLFGFHDLIISNKEGNKYLSLESSIINRPPLPGELFGVGYIQDGSFIKVGETTAMNYPQGARQQWVGESNYFTVNNRVGNKWGTDLYDAQSNALVDRFETASHMISKDGKYSYGLDYARLFRLGGYGYSGIEDRYKSDIAPIYSGITKMNLETKEVQLLVSVREVAECGASNKISESNHYLTHLNLNPSCNRLAFLHRYSLPDGGGITRLMTIGVDGSGLRCLAQGFLSHYDWKDDNHIYIYGRANSSFDSIRDNRILSLPLISSSVRLAKKIIKTVIGQRANNLGKSFLMISDSENPEILPFAQDIIPLDGHPMTNPVASDWCVNDTYPDQNGDRILMLYNFANNLRLNLGVFKMIFETPDMSKKGEFFSGLDVQKANSLKELAFTRSGLHCDLHPRWNFAGTEVLFDSIHEGSRQIYKANVEHLIKNT